MQSIRRSWSGGGLLKVPNALEKAVLSVLIFVGMIVGGGSYV